MDLIIISSKICWKQIFSKFIIRFFWRTILKAPHRCYIVIPRVELLIEQFYKEKKNIYKTVYKKKPQAKHISLCISFEYFIKNLTAINLFHNHTYAISCTHFVNFNGVTLTANRAINYNRLSEFSTPVATHRRASNWTCIWNYKTPKKCLFPIKRQTAALAQLALWRGGAALQKPL